MIEKKEKDLLDKMKNQLKDIVKLPEDSFGSEEIKNKDKRPYYLKDIKNNCFNGKASEELKADVRANAIRSSATMIYNTLGDEETHVFIDKNNYSVTKYESQLPGLIGRTKPHLDVELTSVDGNKKIFIEAKCLEWLSSSEKLSCSYLEEKNYGDEHSKIFIDWFKAFVQNEDIEQDEYKSIYTRYNSKQMNIHILGIYNWCKEKKKNKENLPKEINLLNVVWAYDDSEEYQTEELEGLEYCAKANDYFSKFFKDTFNLSFTVEYVRYPDFINRIDWTYKMERRNYIKRYELEKNYISKKDLDLNLNETVKGYAKRVYSLSQLRDTANEYKQDNPDIENLKEKFIKIYNYPENIIPREILKEVYPNLEENFKEEWHEVPEWFYAYYNIKNLKYEASNLGRIRIGNNYLTQDDKYGYKGYLVLSNSKENEDLGIKNHSIEVYKFISAAFLGAPADCHIHHINNNGYECRPENLILLTPRQHSKVHGFFVTGDDRKKYD